MKLNEKFEKKLDNINKQIEGLPDDTETIKMVISGFILRQVVETQQMIDDFKNELFSEMDI